MNVSLFWRQKKALKSAPGLLGAKLQIPVSISATDWKTTAIVQLSERLAPLGVMGTQFMVPLEPLGTIFTVMVRGVSGRALSWSYKPDRGYFSSTKPRNCGLDFSYHRSSKILEPLGIMGAKLKAPHWNNLAAMFKGFQWAFLIEQSMITKRGSQSLGQLYDCEFFAVFSNVIRNSPRRAFPLITRHKFSIRQKLRVP